MPFSAKAVGNFYLDEAAKQDRFLTAMHLQKLVYFAHGWHLALRNEQLISDNIEAWKFGPVIPALYHEFKVFGDQPITSRATEFNFDSWELTTCAMADENWEQAAKIVPLLNRVLAVYSPFSAIQLSNMTHEPGSPWRTMYDKFGGEPPKHTIIPVELIKEYFIRLANAPRTIS